MEDPISEGQSPLYIPADAPFTEAQRHWLNGFFAGARSRLARRDEEGAASTTPITILYGTQTGNSEGLALRAGDLARERGMKPSVLGMDDINPEDFSGVERMLIVISTYGEGEMPDNAQTLWEAMSAEGAPKLEGLNYSVLSLGDTNYDLFCQAGKDWDRRLQELGAARAYDRVDCDLDFEAPFETWVDGALNALGAGAASAVSSGVDASTGKEEDTAVKWSKKNPFPAKLLKNELITSPESSKETRHYEISLAGSGMDYSVGDALGVQPINDPDLVNQLLQSLGASGDELVPGTQGEEPVPLREALATHYEVKTPTRKLIVAVAERSEDAELLGLIREEAKDALKDFMWGRDVIDLLVDYPKAKLEAETFVGLLSRLNPRLYSIASSIAKHPDEVHLTVASVRYDSRGRERKGVCSTYMADLVPIGETMPVFLAPNKHFGVPEDDGLPMIMVGPGTGIAPFRAFLEEREVRDAKGKNWLFFGDRTRKDEFLYEEQLEGYVKSGLLNRLDLAFSRDQAEKVYVQDRMRENGAELYAWMEEGGYFFVCGDASRMAKDVDQALHDVIAEHGKMSAEDAAEYVKRLKKEKRYVRDVY